MAIADFNSYLALLDNRAGSTFYMVKAQSSGFNEIPWYSPWTQVSFPTAGATPTTPTALNYTGALGVSSIRRPSVGAGRLCLVSADATGPPASSLGGAASCMLVDRLSHQGGIVGNLGTSQTTNLPTAALTRYTSGVGVMIGLQWYTSWGSTDTVINIYYTNQAGTPGRAATLNVVTTPFAPYFAIASLQAGDTGARSVESVQLANSTGTAGNMGIVLFKPLAMFRTGLADTTRSTQIVGWNEPILDEAHLEIMTMGISSGTLVTVLTFAEV